jgi:hypothetical protein
LNKQGSNILKALFNDAPIKWISPWVGVKYHPRPYKGVTQTNGRVNLVLDAESNPAFTEFYNLMNHWGHEHTVKISCLGTVYTDIVKDNNLTSAVFLDQVKWYDSDRKPTEMPEDLSQFEVRVAQYINSLWAMPLERKSGMSIITTDIMVRPKETACPF